MRSHRSHTITSGEVQRWSVEWLLQAKVLKDHGWKCSAAVVWSIVLRSAARMISLSAARRDLAGAPSQQALLNALVDGLPKTLKVLERRLNEALLGVPLRTLRRRKWELAIDWHLVPYYGEPFRSRNELYYGQPRQGTSTFHAYATACIVSHGHRYTLAVSWARRHESLVTVLKRLIAQIRAFGVKIRYVLLDRAFFNIPVIEFLHVEQLPYLMPVVFRGRKLKPGRAATGLRAIQQRPVGWYSHTLKNHRRQAAVRVCVTYRTHKNRKDGRRVQDKLLFAAWRITGSPREIRKRYRTRFGIETSYRQMRQAKIYTCTRNPRLRLVFFLVALLIRNLWVWIHLNRIAERRGKSIILHLERLRFKQLLDWIAQAVVALLHDGTTPYIKCRP